MTFKKISTFKLAFFHIICKSIKFSRKNDCSLKTKATSVSCNDITTKNHINKSYSSPEQCPVRTPTILMSYPKRQKHERTLRAANHNRA